MIVLLLTAQTVAMGIVLGGRPPAARPRQGRRHVLHCDRSVCNHRRKFVCVTLFVSLALRLTRHKQVRLVAGVASRADVEHQRQPVRRSNEDGPAHT
jgi:hypothetical protein